MANDVLFSILGNAILLGWLCILAALFLNVQARMGRGLYLIGGVFIPSALATLPVWEELLNHQARRGSLFSLEGIQTRFSDPDVLFLLYFEALAFSLFVGGLIVRDRGRQAIPRFITLPALVILFFKGPIGALLYGAARWGLRRRRIRTEV